MLDDATERKIRSVAAALDVGAKDVEVLAGLVADGFKIGEARLILTAAKVYRPSGRTPVTTP